MFSFEVINRLTRGALYLMLQNKIYIGEIIHKDQSYPGQHNAIINDDFWQAVQAQLQDNRIERKVQSNAADPSLLAGLLYNEQGEPLSPSHANKKGVRYRYYVSQSLIKQTAATASGNNAWRLPANQIETLVQDRIIAFLNNAQAIHAAAEAQDIDNIATRHSLAQHAAALATDWPQKNTAHKRELFLEIIEKVAILKDQVRIDLYSGKLLAVLGHSCEETNPRSGELITLSVKATLKRTGMQMRLIIEGQAPKAEPDKALIRLMALAHRYNTLIHTNEGATISALAKEAGVSSSYFTRILRLSYVSPQIKKLILQGKQPYHLTAKSLVNNTNLPLLWSEQEQVLEV